MGIRDAFELPVVNLVPPISPVKAVVSDTYICTYGQSRRPVQHIEIDLSGTPLSGSIRAGQSLGVIPPKKGTSTPAKFASFYRLSSPSIASGDADKFASLCVSRIPGEGEIRFSGNPLDQRRLIEECDLHLCDLKVGDKLLIAGPTGRRFVMPATPSNFRFVLLATGTGVAPYRGFLMDLERSGVLAGGIKIHLIVGAEYGVDLLYHRQLLQLASKFPNFRYHWALSKESGGTLKRRADLSEIVAGLPETFELLRAPNTLLYISGLAGMQRRVYESLVELGVQQPYLTETKRGGRIQVRPSNRCLVEVY